MIIECKTTICQSNSENSCKLIRPQTASENITKEAQPEANYVSWPSFQLPSYQPTYVIGLNSLIYLHDYWWSPFKINIIYESTRANLVEDDANSFVVMRYIDM